MRLVRIGLIMGVIGAMGVAAAQEAAQGEVRAWEGQEVIPTYPWTPEDPNPRFQEFEGSVFYPYTMQDNLSGTKTDRTYKALYLENEYLKVTCLPELGGRIHSVLDKTEPGGKQMFHLNKVIKPGLIAMRGAWISGGIEWNPGPHGHTVTIVSPVDATIVKNDDGSASLVIGNTEKMFRTRWTVRLTLRPGKSFLEERIAIFNPTDGYHPFYFWNNTAFPCKPGTRYIYPMSLGTDHNGVEFFRWPIHEGRDMTWLKNYPDMTSTFAYNCVYDFFGAYDVDDDRGIVQYANHGLVPGKKAWTWGQSDFGLVSQESLTDDDGPYIEVQSGPLATQSDYEFLAPRQQVAWEEWWYPVHGLGDGFEYATRDVAVQSYRKDGGLELRILATGRFPNARCVLKDGERVLLEKELSLSPTPVSVTLASAPENVSVGLYAADGSALAEYTTPLPIPQVDPPTLPKDKPEAEWTAEEAFLKAARLDKNTDRAAAREGYAKVLAKDPQHAGALRALGVLDLETGQYESARDRLQASVERRVDDSMAWALLGLAHLRLGDADAAVEAAYRGARLLDAAPFAWDVVGRARMRRGEYHEAANDFLRAASARRHDYRAWDHWLLALLASGQRENALRLAEKRVADDPMALIPRAVLQEEPMPKATVRQALDILGEPEFELLDAAWTCMDMLRPDLAYRLATAVPSPTAAAEYHAAYFAHVAGNAQAAAAHLEKARQLTTDYAFVAFPEAIDALRYALDQKADDSHALLILGNLFAGLGRIDEAVDAWKKTVEIDTSLSVAYRNLAMHAWKTKTDLAEADSLLAKAIEARSDDELLYRDRAQVLLALNRRPEAIELLRTRPTGERPRTDATVMLVRALVDEKQYDIALEVLATSDFSNWEGQSDSWDLFNRAHVERGKLRLEAEDAKGALEDFTAALTYPKNLKVGRPAKPRESEAQYWKGCALKALGQTAEAVAAWKEGAQGEPVNDTQKEYIEKCNEALNSAA